MYSHVTYRPRWIVMLQNQPPLFLSGGFHDIAEAFVKRRFGQSAEILPWAAASDALRAKALERPALVCPANPRGRESGNAQMGSMQSAGGGR